MKVSERELQRDGVKVPLTPKEFDTLVLLAAHAGKLVDKEQLRREIWPGTHVTDAALQKVLSELRKSLGQTEDEVWIETVPKFGYRLRLAHPVEETAVEPLIAAKAAAPKGDRRWRWGVALAVCAGIAIWFVGGRINGGAAGPDWGTVGMVEVEPLTVGGDAPEAASIGNGVAEELARRLRSVATVVPPSQHGRVRAARLEGKMESAAGKWTAEMWLRSRDGGAELWRRRVSAGSVPELEEVMARALLAGSEGSGREWVRRKAPTPESHALYLRARQEWNRRDQQSIERARDLFAQAIDLEPTYARAYAGVADCYLLLGGYGAMPQLESLPKAKAMATRALELDPQLPEAWATLGLIVQNLDWDWKAAEQHYLRAIEIDPTYATAQHWYAEFLSIQGRFEESHRYFARARKLDPLTPMIAADEALAYIYARDWEKARQVLEQVIQLEPGQPDAWERLAWVDALEGKEEAAWQKVQQIEACRKEQSPCAVRWTAWLPGRGRDRAAAALAQMEANPGQFPLHCRLIAQARQGNLPRALAVLREMKEKHAIWLITAKVNPWFDALRGEAGMRQILAGFGWS